MEPLIGTIELSDEQHSCQLFSGFRGTGKTTELQRLKGELERREFIVLYSDAADYHDLRHVIDIESLIVIIAAAFGDAASELHGDAAASQSYFERLREFLADTEVSIDGLAGKGGGAGLKFGLEHRRPLWLEVRDQLSESLAQLKEHAHDFIQAHIEKLKEEFPEKQNQGVVFILDSLERLSSPGGDFQDILESVVGVFSSYDDFLKLPDCHSIYTVPLSLQYIDTNIAETYDSPLFILPSIKVMEQNGETYLPGVTVIDEVLDQRVDLDEIFGSHRDGAVQRLALASAGHIRTLISMMQDLLLIARRDELPVSDAALDEVIERTKENYQNAVRAEHLPILRGIHASHSPHQLTTEQLPLFARLLNNQLVLCYRNGSGWLEVHPLVHDMISVQDDSEDHARPHSPNESQ